MPDVLPENRLAIRMFGDMRTLGFEFTWMLNDIELGEYEASDLLMKLRVLSNEVDKIQMDHVKEV